MKRIIAVVAASVIAAMALPAVAGAQPKRMPPSPTITGIVVGWGTATATWTSSAVGIRGYVASVVEGSSTKKLACVPARAKKTTTHSGCTISGLHNGTSYTFALAVKTNAGTSVATVTHFIPGLIPPLPSIVGTTATVGGLSVQWTENVPMGAAPLTRFDVIARDGTHSTSCPSLVVNLAQGQGSCSFSNLTSGTVYTVTVTAINAIGNSPGASTAIVPLRAPLPPTPRPHVPPAITLSTSWVAPGGIVGVGGVGFAPSTPVALRITAVVQGHLRRVAHDVVDLGTAAASSSGTLDTSTTIPTTVTSRGVYNFSASGTDDQGNPVSVVQQIAVGFDTAPPVLDGPSGANPLSVTTPIGGQNIDTTSGPTSIQVSVGVSDDLSGVAQVMFRLQPEPRQQANGGFGPMQCDGTLVPGTAVLAAGAVVYGVYACTIPIGQYWSASSYLSVFLGDQATNELTPLETGPSQGEGGYSPSDLLVTNIAPPVDPFPHLDAQDSPGGLTVSSNHLDVASGPVTVTYTLGFSKAVSSPVQIIVSYLHIAQGRQVAMLQPSRGNPAPTLISGTPEDGIWQWSETFSSQQPVGTYECPIITIADGLADYQFAGCPLWGAADLSALGYDVSQLAMSVTTALNYAGAKLVAANDPGALSCPTLAIDTSAGPQTIECTMNVSLDAVADPTSATGFITFSHGVSTCSGANGSCSGQNFAGGVCREQGSSVNADGTVTLTCTATFAANIASGSWSLLSISACEYIPSIDIWAWNGFSPADLVNLGYDPSVFTVVNASASS